MIEILSRPLPKRQISRLLMVDLAVVLVLLALPVRTSWNSYQSARADLREQQRLQGEYAMRLSQAQRAVSDQPIIMGEIRASLALLSGEERRLRPPSDAATILEEIRDLILSRRLNLMSLTQQDPRRQSGFEEQQIVIVVQGSFIELMRLMHALRHQETFMITDRMILSVAEEDNRNPVLTMEANLRTVLVENVTPFRELAAIVGDTTEVGEDPVEPPGSDEGGMSTSGSSNE
jgi:hypothetical protein